MLIYKKIEENKYQRNLKIFFSPQPTTQSASVFKGWMCPTQITMPHYQGKVFKTHGNSEAKFMIMIEAFMINKTLPEALPRLFKLKNLRGHSCLGTSIANVLSLQDPCNLQSKWSSLLGNTQQYCQCQVTLAILPGHLAILGHI